MTYLRNWETLQARVDAELHTFDEEQRPHRKIAIPMGAAAGGDNDTGDDSRAIHSVSSDGTFLFVVVGQTLMKVRLSCLG